MDLEKAKEYIIRKLKNDLDPRLLYHSVDHTLDVHSACVRLLALEGVEPDDCILAETAALYHDSGMLVAYENHEQASIVIVREVLPGFGYNDEQIEKICRMIRCTELPQKACGLIGKVLCDADMDYLGRTDFFTIADKLRCEWGYKGHITDLTEWYNIQYDFLRRHEYFTLSAQKLRNEVKRQNLMQVEKLLAACS